MGKRPFLSMAAGLICGISIAVYGKTQMLWAGTFMGLVFLIVMRKHIRGMSGHDRNRIWKHQCFVTLLFIMALFFGWHHCRAVQAAENRYLPYLEDGEEILFAGKISAKERKNEQYFYYMSACQIRQDSKIRMQQELPAKVMVYCESDTYSIGQTLVLHGKIKLFGRASNDGNFDQAAYYRARGISFAIRDAKVQSVYGKENSFSEKLYQWKCRLAQIYEQALGVREGGVLNTMLLGEKSLLDEEVKQFYRTSGISHILAISGLHISLIGMTFYRLLRRGRLGFWEAGILSAVLMLSYGRMAGMGYSIIRAVSMFCILLLAQAVGRSYDSLNALGFAAVLILCRNPYALYDAGLQFSFAAVFGVVWAGKIVQNTYQDHALLQKLGVGFVLQLVILPVTAWYFFEIPVYAMLINIVVLPFAGIVLASGIAGGLLGFFMIPQKALAKSMDLLSTDFVSMDAVIAKGTGLAWKWKLVRIVLLPCHVILNGYEKICAAVAKLPDAQIITGKPSGIRLMVYYLLLVTGLCLLFSVTRHQTEKQKDQKQKQQSRNNNREQVEQKISGKMCRSKRPGWVHEILPFFCGGCLLVFLFVPRLEGMKLAVLDVGQGDGIYLHTDSGYHIFIDGGSTNVQSVGKYRILPYLKANGVRAVDYWVVSHTDSDHISGLLELLEEGYSIRNLVIFKGMVQDDGYEKLLSLAREHDVNICSMSRKNILHLGGARLTAVSPGYRIGDEDRGEESVDKNEESLVLFYEENGFSALFTGDIGESQEKQILDWGEIADIDFYKAAHHGSKYSNTKEWLDVLSPRISVISCAKKNRYGHPGREAVEHIKDTGSALFYTMEDGQITVTRKKEKRLVTETYLKPDKQFVFER